MIFKKFFYLNGIDEMINEVKWNVIVGWIILGFIRIF